MKWKGFSEGDGVKKKSGSRFLFRRLIVLIGAVVLLLGLYNIVSGAGIIVGNTSRAIKTEYLDKIDTKGYLILNEKVYTAQGDGVVDYNVRDGARVAKDYMIANLSLMSDVSNLKDELLKVQSAIEYKNQSLNPSNAIYEISEKEINLINSIQDALVEDNLGNALVAIETLELNTKKNIDISEIGELINLSNQELEDRRDSLSKEISTNNVIYKAETAGVVSFKIDKVESKYSIENMENINYEFIEKNKPTGSQGQMNNVKTGDPLYKLIDNFEYFMALPVDKVSSIEGYSVNDRIELLVDGKIPLMGTIQNINVTDDQAVIIAKLKVKLSELGYDRSHDVGIIKDRIKSYVIKTGSIVEINNRTGVYVKELNGIVKFRPIEIIVQNEIDTIISTGNSKGFIEDPVTGEDTRTITLFDELINEPMNIEEGQILR